MRVRLTHLLYGNGQPADGLGREIAQGERRVFVPGWLPCGECARCRRGLVAVCPRGRRLIEGEGPVALEHEVDGRFVTGIDEPVGVAPLDDAHAACAGAVASVIEATARAGLGPEQVSVWLGLDPRSRIGARFAAKRGCPSLVAAHGQPPSVVDVGVTVLPASAAAWADAVRAVAPIGPELRPRRLFVAGDEPEAAADAMTLVEPGTTLVFLGAPAAAVRIDQLVLCRVLIGGGRYHPDLIPEALAALRTDPDLVDGLLVSGADRSPGYLALVGLGETSP
jgi:D-arabinose 1-dehydrogenase-like Zn-dependent alcohol dehydrogenase